MQLGFVQWGIVRCGYIITVMPWRVIGVLPSSHAGLLRNV